MRIKMKRFLGILLSLALVLSLFPSVSLTAYADNNETLLTTITATGKEQANYSTANVATVSFSYTAGGSSAYLANWGWWGYGWTVTVAPANGYTITKCVFYDDANRTATDGEAPFVVETTEEDKTPQVNGTPILAYTSKGIKKIEVYGYATPAHTHDFTYSASGATITATCSADGCDLDDGTEQHNHTATLTIAAEGGTYDGTTAYSATVTNNIPAVTGDTVGDVAYYKVDTQDATTGGTVQTGAPTGAGYYYASVTLTSGSNTYTAVKAFTVAKIDPTAPTGLTATYGQKLSDVVLPTGWTWADSTQSAGNVVSPAATFKANFAGDDNYKAASNVDVTVTVSKADATTAMQAASVSIAGTSGKTATVSCALPDGASYGAVTNSNTEFFTVDTTNGLVLTAAKSWTASDWATDASKTFTVAVSGATNYNNYTLTVTVTPTYKATQTITAADVTATYGDTDAKIEATTTSGGGTLSYMVKSGDAVTVNENTGALTIVKAGSAVITVIAAENDTYAAATKDVNVTVNTKAMTVSAENVNVYVDGQPHGITVNVTEPATGYTVKYGTEAGTYDQTTSPTQTEVGEKTVYYQVTADNYTTYTGSAKVTVSAKQTQTITAADVTATYGDTGVKINASTTGDGGLSYAVKSGDAVTVNETTGALTIVKAGSAIITVTASETATYEPATKEVTVTINKANAVAATVTANNRTYDGTEKPLVTVTGTPTGGTMQYALGENATTTPDESLYTTSIPTETNAGIYYVWYMVKGDADHSDTDAACVTVTVEPKTVGLTWGESSFTYDGKSHAPTATATNLVNNDAIGVTVSGGQTNAGDTAYTATATDLTGEKASNYKLPDAVTHTFTIGQKAVTITAASDEKVYDGMPLTKESCTNTDLAAGDKIDSVTYTGSQTVAGKSDNVPSAAVIKNAAGDDVTKSYAITYVNGTLEVTQKAVTITAESDTKVYDGTELTKNAVTNSGLASGDRIASVTVTGSQTVKGKSDNVASAVKIVNTNGDDVTACYNVTYSKGSLEVTARPVTVTPQNNSKTYGESDPELTATVTDLVPGETLNYTLSRETGETANTYTISVNLGSNPNYSVTTDTATFTIHKAELSELKVTLAGWTYGDEPNTPVVTGNVENGDVEFFYQKAEQSGLKARPAGITPATNTDVGEYEVTAYVYATDNYKSGEASCKFTISPKSIEGSTVSLVSDKLEFTGQEQKVEIKEVEIKEVKIKDGMTVDTYTVKGVTTATDCNTYTVTVTGTGNYKDEATTTWKIYKVDENKSEATDGTRTVTGEVNTTPDAPETTANVDLDFAKSLLDDGDSATENVNVYLQVDQKDKNDLSDTDKNAVGKELKTNSGVGMYMNMELYKKVGDEAAEAQATSKPLTVTMTVPEAMQSAAQAGYSRSFSVMQVVNGVATTVAGAKYDAKTGQITFPATQFTTDNQEVTYALVYTDTAKGGNGEFINLGGGSAASSTMSSFTMTTDLTGINKVTVDGKTVDPQYYTVSGGNVTLSPDYIKTLRSGTHILQAENATHVSTAKFTVKSALTADGGMGIYVSLMALGLMVAAALLSSRKRRQYCR